MLAVGKIGHKGQHKFLSEDRQFHWCSIVTGNVFLEATANVFLSNGDSCWFRDFSCSLMELYLCYKVTTYHISNCTESNNQLIGIQWLVGRLVIRKTVLADLAF